MAPPTELLNYLLPLISTSLFSIQNDSKSTSLHWAALNSHLPVVQALIQHPNSPGASLIDIKNKAGRTAVGEAEIVGKEEADNVVANWLVSQMLLDPEGDEKKLAQGESTSSSAAPTATEEKASEMDADDAGEDVEVDLFKLKIDADGKMDVTPAQQ